MTAWMLYGAYGFTGRLVAEEAVAQGLQPILAGRREDELAPLAAQLELPYRVFDLEDERALAAEVAAVDLVLHVAGAHVHTAAPMRRACLKGKTHYVDIAGELDVIETTFACDAAARDAGVTLISGAGFDAIPMDCLARYVAKRLPEATELEIAYASQGSPSAGTVKTALEQVPRGGFVRRQGRLVAQRLGRDVRQVRFSHGKLYTVMAIPSADLSLAYYSTGIGDISSYLAIPPRVARAGRWLLPVLERLLRVGAVRRIGQWLVDRIVSGPDAETRRTAQTYVWARASTADGLQREAWLECVEAYRFTAQASLLVVTQVLERQSVGALAPAQAFGADFVLQLPGSKRYDSLPQARTS
ncbi:MAG: saccharopine dehydrogenase NADP-binding domain-containing protein [Candidatus Promineifilaceae bacterium]|nr:saccharopine dehydrogenase NADP-binding domain-containing protein [Candidatus Promineifilaceae bacterium]